MQGGGGGVMLSTKADNTLLDLQNSSYPTQPHSIIANSAYANTRRQCILRSHGICCVRHVYRELFQSPSKQLEEIIVLSFIFPPFSLALNSIYT